MKKLELPILYVAVLFLLLGAWGLWKEKEFWQEKAELYRQAYFQALEINDTLHRRR